MMLNKVGPPVEGQDFYGRENEIEESWGDLRDGNHLLVIAPRRVGKSSLVKKLVEKARDENWKSVYIDVQHVKTEYEFYKVFYENIKDASTGWLAKGTERLLSKAGDIISGIELEFEQEGAKVKLQWSGKKVKALQEEISSLIMQLGDFLIAIDELPFFLARLEAEDDGKTRINDFLHWLRAFRQIKSTKIRWIFCGSIGLDTFTQRLKLTESLNDILPYSVGAFDDGTAKSFLRELGNDNGMMISENIAAKIVEKLGWPLPFFLQSIFKQLKRIRKGVHISIAISIDDIEKAYSKLVELTPALKTWEERLDLQLQSPENDLCKMLLTEISRFKKGLNRKKLFDHLFSRVKDVAVCENMLSRLLMMLMNDGYLILEQNQYSFRSPVLRDFWYNTKIR